MKASMGSPDRSARNTPLIASLSPPSNIEVLPALPAIAVDAMAVLAVVTHFQTSSGVLKPVSKAKSPVSCSP